MIDIRQEVTATIEATVLVVATLFPIVNPLGSAAIFVNLVGPIAFTTQRLLAQKIAIYSFFLLLCSLLWGVHVLAFFGICDLRGTDWRRPGGRRYRMVSPEPGHRTSESCGHPGRRNP